MTTNWDKLEKQLTKQNKKVAQEPGKVFGECECCGMETVLVEEVGLCGPCCFGEADTINGNW
jgi:ribosomal protein S14